MFILKLYEFSLKTNLNVGLWMKKRLTDLSLTDIKQLQDCVINKKKNTMKVSGWFYLY